MTEEERDEQESLKTLDKKERMAKWQIVGVLMAAIGLLLSAAIIGYGALWKTPSPVVEKEKQEQTTANKTVLENLIKSSMELVDSNLYTPSTASNLHVAINNADAVCEKASTTQRDLDKEAESIMAGVKALVRKDAPAPTQAPKPKTYADGTYKVGQDIAAGEYKLTATSDVHAYYAVTASSAADAGIVGNDNFLGSTYLTVEDGQYLKLSRCIAAAS